MGTDKNIKLHIVTDIKLYSYSFRAKYVRELRLHLCQKSQSSLGVRNFVEQHYVDIKRNNPDLPILILECSGVQPRLIARFDYGVERSVDLIDKDADEVVTSIETLVMNKLTYLQHLHQPSFVNLCLRILYILNIEWNVYKNK